MSAVVASRVKISIHNMSSVVASGQREYMPAMCEASRHIVGRVARRRRGAWATTRPFRELPTHRRHRAIPNDLIMPSTVFTLILDTCG